MSVKTPTKGLFLPKNRRSPERAERTLERVAQVAQQQYVNAIYVNGVPCFIYPRLEAGRACTCRSSTQTPMMDEAGHLTQDAMQTLLLGSDVMMREAGERSPVERPDGKERFNFHELETFKLDGQPQTSDPLADLVEPYVIGDEDPSESDSARSIIQEQRGLSSEYGGRNSCGVCYGTNYIGGFDLYGGQRIVMDTTHPGVDGYLYHVDTQKAPNAWVSDGRGAYVDFPLVLPRSVSVAHALRVFDNNKVINDHNYSLEIKPQGGAFVPLSRWVLVDHCLGLPAVLRIKSTVDDFRFTHIEIQLFFLSDPPRVDFPKLDKNPYIAIFDGLTGSQLIIPPTVSNIPYLSIICDGTYGKAWSLTSISEFNDHRQNIHGWEALGRLVQDYETIGLLTRPAAELLKPAAQTRVRHLGNKRSKFL